jgi:hypothetical protein
LKRRGTTEGRVVVVDPIVDGEEKMYNPQNQAHSCIANLTFAGYEIEDVITFEKQNVLPLDLASPLS